MSLSDGFEDYLKMCFKGKMGSAQYSDLKRTWFAGAYFLFDVMERLAEAMDKEEDQMTEEEHMAVLGDLTSEMRGYFEKERKKSEGKRIAKLFPMVSNN